MIIVVDPVFNPNKQSSISASTKLGPGVTIAKFLGAYGDRTAFNHVGSNDDRKQIARQLYLQAEMMRVIQGNIELFNDVRLIVSEGIYREGPTETLAGDTSKKNKGELVYYQVINKNGTIDYEKTFDIAEYWKDYTNFNELRLDYDTYNPDGSLTASIGIEMPTVSETFNVNFKNDVKTFFNNSLQSADELVEIKEN
tara:strand:- start:711 stop:1301 length:591 start_codon:yes stop_codon:yes gene_type:complete